MFTNLKTNTKEDMATLIINIDSGISGLISLESIRIILPITAAIAEAISNFNTIATICITDIVMFFKPLSHTNYTYKPLENQAEKRLLAWI